MFRLTLVVVLVDCRYWKISCPWP